MISKEAIELNKLLKINENVIKMKLINCFYKGFLF
jgi:hypothetical protein